MIKLYRKENSQQADTIEAEFREETSLPVITDNEQVVSGQEMPDDLQELRGLRRDWQRSQSDTCYVDEDERFC